MAQATIRTGKLNFICIMIEQLIEILTPRLEERRPLFALYSQPNGFMSRRKPGEEKKTVPYYLLDYYCNQLWSSQE
jgi:hypothetical protein